MTLDEFADQYHQEILTTADAVESGEFLEDAFAESMSETLTEAGETEDPIICNYHARGMKVNAYCVSDNGETLDLFICSYHGGTASLAKVTRGDIDGLFQQLQSLFLKCLEGNLTKRLEMSAPIYDLAQTIVELREELTTIRMFLITDGVAAVETWPPATAGRYAVQYSIWDMQRLFRMEASGMTQEPIEINLLEDGGFPIPCLSVSRPADGYEAYLAIIPGTVLASLYSKYGARLLERNVRSYLQARGKVNKGILRTIADEPQWFLAYNNGISATAEAVAFTQMSNGTTGIASMKNFQIVNGGQTTASIHRAQAHLGEDISQVFVQCKLCVVPPSEVENVVPKISRCANTQNKVNEADFYANDRYQVDLELLSRNVWAPASEGTQRQTHWFYERARGQFADARARQGTRARATAFDAVNPRNQKFTKTDLAKFENTWRQLPHKVSLGAEKNFSEFRIYLAANPDIKVDESYLHTVIAKAILFRRAERIVQSLNFGGYRANVVTYTLAYIFFHTDRQIDLEQIWKEQDISDLWQASIQTVAKAVYDSITNPPAGTSNVTEWCKKSSCWDTVQALDVLFDFDRLLARHPLSLGHAPKYPANTDGGAGHVVNVIRVPAQVWYKLAVWGKQTMNLRSWEWLLATTLGKRAEKGVAPSRDEAAQGEELLRRAQELGFQVLIPDAESWATGPHGDRI